MLTIKCTYPFKYWLIACNSSMVDCITFDLNL
jgi:hypothetical protein